MHDAKELSRQWIIAKQAEHDAVTRRREIEDRLVSMIGIKETFEGTKKTEFDEYQVKITGRMSRTVDTDRLQELAIENGLFEHLHSLFRWKAEINAAQWKLADQSITTPLMGAITTKPGRPSFKIEERKS